jgi:hypothetical protein
MLCMSNKQGTKFYPRSNFQKHIQATHPNVTCSEMPPEHTLIIKGHITSSISNTTQQRIDRHLRHRKITTCGDAHVMMGGKHIDPDVCIYIGAYLIFIHNKHLRDKDPWENRALCQVLGVQLKENAQSYKWKNYYGKKVWTVNADDVE